MSTIAKRSSSKHVVQPNKATLLNRLRRIEGQMRGVAKMVEEDRYCVDILTQVSAAQSALDAVTMELLESHTRGCVQDAIKAGDAKRSLAEWMAVVKKLIR